MGIRFWCPNGHKLNVKSFQAGRRGICPYCGARFQIPTQSTRKPGAQDRAPEPEEHSVHEGLGDLPPASAPASNTPQAGPLATGPLASAQAPQAGPAAAGPMQPTEPALGAAATTGPTPAPADAAAQAAFASVPSSPSPPTPSVAAVDPLAEAPNAVWYVRPPTGGQFGPATADVMRNWLGEGRVSPDSYVWREGWRDWQEAADVFPQLGTNDALGLGNLAVPASAAAGAVMPAARRGRSKAANAAIIVALVVAVVVLFAVFLYVAFGGGGKTSPADGPGKSPVSMRLPGPADMPSGRFRAPSAPTL